MKKPIALLICLFLLASTTMAQQPKDVRTVGTKIADLLAQFPAADANQLNSAMEEMAGLQVEGISQLIGTFSPSGTVDNSKLEYAIAGFTGYASQPGKENLRQMGVKAFCAGLAKLEGDKNKAFIITQLQIIGKDDAVPCLKSYLAKEPLSGYAARSLAGINTAAANEALVAGLSSASIAGQISIAEALGDTKFSGALSAITPLASSKDENLQKTALFALAAIADPASEPVLEQAAAQAGYTFDDHYAVAAYLQYGKNLLEAGKGNLAEKVANKIIKKSKSDNLVHTRTAALTLLSTIQGAAGVPLLIKASGDKNAEYRASAIKLASAYATPANTALWLKKLNKATPGGKVEIIGMLGQSRAEAALPAVLNLLGDKNVAVRLAAIEAAGKIGQEKVLDNYIDILKKGDVDEVKAVKNALLIMKGTNLTHKLAQSLPQMQSGAKVAIIEVLAARGAQSEFDAVYPLLKSNEAGVSQASYAALKNLSGQKQLSTLFELLSSVGQEHIPDVQTAIGAALMDIKAKDAQAQLVLEYMGKAAADKKALFYPLLSTIGSKNALEAVSSAFKAGDANTKGAALNALAAWTDADAMSTLLSIIKDSKSPEHLDKSIKGYVRLIGLAALPPAQKLLLLKEVMEYATTPEQKRLILAEVGNNKTFPSLVYAGKYLDDADLQQRAANVVMDIALSDKSYYGDIVRDLLTKTMSVMKGGDSEYLREAMRKHIAEMPEGEGFVSIFNGKDLTGWKGLVANPIERAKMDAKTLAAAQVKADEEMRKNWVVKDGEIVYVGHGGDNLTTVKQYGDIEMVLDWKIIYTGTDNGDAGIYLRGTPQVQIWDTSRVSSGAQVGSGGLYNNKVNESKPLKVADNPLDSWNHFRILMSGDRVTVYLNGELVTDNVVLENFWDRSLPLFAKEQIELQAHGSPVAYRDLYIREIPRPDPYELTEEEKKEGYKILFDGTNMNSWTGNMVDYTIEKGELAVHPKPGTRRGDLFTKEEYSDFIFRFEFKLTEGANNGLGIRAPLEGNAAYDGMELQILDNEADIYKSLDAYQYHGSVYGTLPAKRGYLKPVGEWNQQEVIVQGPKIKVILNGTVILDGDITEARKNGAPDGKDHPGLKRDKGHIGFLGHGSVLYFRNIRVKDLSKK